MSALAMSVLVATARARSTRVKSVIASAMPRWRSRVRRGPEREILLHIIVIVPLVSRTRSPLPKLGVDRRRWEGATTRNSWRYSEEEQRSQRRRAAPEFGDGLRVRDTRFDSVRAGYVAASRAAVWGRQCNA